jgi:hypothetical protein
MTAIEAAREALANGAQLVRLRKEQPDTDQYQYDVKPLFTGSHRHWTILDSFSASAIVAVHDRLNPINQAHFASLPLDRMADWAFLCIARAQDRAKAS